MSYQLGILPSVRSRFYLHVIALVFVLFSPAHAATPTETVHLYRFAKPNEITLSGTELGACMALLTRKNFQHLSFQYRGMHCRPFKPLFGKNAFDKTVTEVLTNAPATPLWKNFTPAEFMDYLEANDQRDCDFVTGSEEKLTGWILKQRDNSINPLSIYQESLTLNHQNIWLALLSIHQVVRNNARWWNAAMYRDSHYDSSSETGYAAGIEREKKFFNKFIDIRGDLQDKNRSDRDDHFVGDHEGSWYRLWGAMLFRASMIVPEEFQKRVQYQCESQDFSISEKFLSAFNNSRANMVFFLDESGIEENKSGEKDGKGKLRIDRAGGEAVLSLYRALSDPSVMKQNHIDEQFCLKQGYLHTQTAK